MTDSVIGFVFMLFQRLPNSLVHYETRSPIAQAGLELSMWTRLVLKLKSFCLSLPHPALIHFSFLIITTTFSLGSLLQSYGNCPLFCQQFFNCGKIHCFYYFEMCNSCISIFPVPQSSSLSGSRTFSSPRRKPHTLPQPPPPAPPGNADTLLSL